MSYTVVTGTVSHSGERITVRAGRRASSSKVTTSFRLDNKPISMEGPADIDDGDTVTAVGNDESGKLQAYILKNESTGVIYNELSPAQIGFVAIGLLLSIILVPFIIGIAMFPFMAWYSFKLYRVKKAQEQLRTLPIPA